MQRTVTIAVLLCFVLAIVGIVALAGIQKMVHRDAPPQTVSVATSLDHPFILFGDQIRATLVVRVDPNKVDEDSLIVDFDPAPFSAEFTGVTEKKGDGVIEKTWQWHIRCLSCLPRDAAYSLPYGTVYYRYKGDGAGIGAVSMNFEAVKVTSRLSSVDLTNLSFRPRTAVPPKFHMPQGLSSLTLAVAAVMSVIAVAVTVRALVVALAHKTVSQGSPDPIAETFRTFREDASRAQDLRSLRAVVAACRKFILEYPLEDPTACRVRDGLVLELSELSFRRPPRSRPTAKTLASYREEVSAALNHAEQFLLDEARAQAQVSIGEVVPQ